MAKEQTWRVTVDGAEHIVTYVRPGLRSGGAALFVDDGEGRPVFSRDGYLDEPVDVGGKECRFVLRNYVPDVAVDGVFLDSGRAYAPVAPVPVWCRILTAATILGLFVLIRSLPVALIASFLAWRGTELIAQRGGMPAKEKITWYLGLLVLMWAAAIILRLVWRG